MEVALEQLDHLVRSRRLVSVDHDDRGIIAIKGGDGRQQIVTLKDPVGIAGPEPAASRARIQ